MNITPSTPFVQTHSILPPQTATRPSRLTRRDFLTRTSAAGAFGAFSAAGVRPVSAAEPAAASPAATTPAGSRPLKLSILSYSFRGLLDSGMMDVFGYLETCKYRYRLDAADIWNGFLTSTDDGYLRKVRAALDERELVLADLCVDKAHVWDDDAAVREQNYANAKAHLRAAGILGARFMRVDAGSRAVTWTDEQFDFIVNRYREYARFAHDHGFKIGAENHWGAEKAWPNLQKLYRAVDHPAFGLSIHLGGWPGTEAEKAACDRQAAPLACHTHIPWNITEGNVEERLAPFVQAGYSGYYSVEHHSGKDEYSEVAIQLARVRDALEKLHSAGERKP